MKKSLKSTLSLILVIAMIFSLGISAFAGDAGNGTEEATEEVTPAATTSAYTTGLTLKFGDADAATASSKTVQRSTSTTVTPVAVEADGVTFNGKIVWKSSNTNVATIVKADGSTALANEGTTYYSEGEEAVVVKAIAKGTAVITATVAQSAKENDTISATINLTVNENTISSIKINYTAGSATAAEMTSNTLYIPTTTATAGTKTTYTFTPKAVYTTGSKENATYAWTTPLPATSAIDASVSGSQLIIKPTAENKSGVSYTITATDANAAGTGMTRTITIKTSDVTALKINEDAEKVINVGDTYTLTATPTGTPTDTITWSSCDFTDNTKNTVVSVSGSGSTATIKGLSSGKAIITATADGYTANYTIEVSATGFTASTTIGTNYSFANICSTLISQYNLANSDEIVFTNISDTNGSLYLADGTKVSTTSVFASSRTYKISDFKGMYMAPSKTGTYTLNYQTGTMTAAGTINIVITNAAVSAKATVLANGTALGMSETNTNTTTSVQAQLESAVSNFSYVIFDDTTITGSSYGTLSAVSGTSYYKTKSSLSSNALLSSVKFTPATTSGTYTIGFTAYDSDSSAYPGTLTITVSPAEYTFQFGAEGYTFKASDFIKSTDTDPIKSVTFTLPTSGVLYTNYSYGKGAAVAKSNSFTSSTLGTLTYIPSASYPMDVNISFTATTTAGKTVSGVAKMDYIERTATLKFNDVSASWAIPAVDFCSTWGIATGTGASTFDPNGTMQRGMLVTMLYRVAGQPSISSAYVNPFSDVYVSDYYYNAVIWAYNMGIVKGTSSTTFSPSTAVSRQDIAVMLARFDGVSSYNANYLGNYKDGANVSSYATAAMNWAIGNGIISGSNGYLTPTSTGTRAQVSVMLHRYLAN